MSMFKQKHICDYKVLGSKNERTMSEGGYERDYTHIMFQCDCGRWYVPSIPGKWSKKEVKMLK